MDPPQPDNQFQRDHAALLLDSFRRWLGRPLLESADPGLDVFDAPFVVVSHDTAEDPIFNYGNRAALRLFERSWQEFTCLPSRLSAEPVNREERARLLAAVSEHNFIDDYSGVRVSATGKRFHVPQAVVWNVVDGEGVYRGQAATFAEWVLLDDGVKTS